MEEPQCCPPPGDILVVPCPRADPARCLGAANLLPGPAPPIPLGLGSSGWQETPLKRLEGC